MAYLSMQSVGLWQHGRGDADSKLPQPELMLVGGPGPACSDGPRRLLQTRALFW